VSEELPRTREGRPASGRRRFIATASGAFATAAAATIVHAPYVIAQPKVQWRMSTAWARSLDVQRTAEQLAKIVEEMSGGRFRIEVLAGGQIMQPFARLCGEARPGQILISQRVLGAAEDQVEAEALGELTLKGFSRPVAAHNVLRWKT
jgi:hypothetical protein